MAKELPRLKKGVLYSVEQKPMVLKAHAFAARRMKLG